MQLSGQGGEQGWGLFPDGWVGEALQLVCDVWTDLELPRSARLEPRITKLLSGAICERYEREDRDWFCVVECPDWNQSGKEISRTDIRLYPPGKKRRSVALVFESKRLNSPEPRAAEYVGRDGMMCFIQQAKRPAKYAAGLPCGVMIGYVMDQNVERANSAVRKAINETRITLRLSGDYRRFGLLRTHELHGVTQHRFSDQVFLIYHLLLPVQWKRSKPRK